MTIMQKQQTPGDTIKMYIAYITLLSSGTFFIIVALQLIQKEMNANHYESFFKTSCQTINSPFIFIEGL